MHLDRSADNVERYKVAKKTVKRAVSEARGQMYDGLYQRLSMKEGEKDIYRMVLSPEIDWSIWAKKRAAIKMGFEDNHGWSSKSAPARVFLGQIRPCIFIVIRV
jgi:hypothetical protein